MNIFRNLVPIHDPGVDLPPFANINQCAYEYILACMRGEVLVLNIDI